MNSAMLPTVAKVNFGEAADSTSCRERNNGGSLRHEPEG
jgi:hypothetical protein